MKSKCLNQKQFLAVIDALKKQYDKDERIDAFIRTELDSHAHFFINEVHSVLWNQLFQLLCDSFPTEIAREDIAYFIYDLEFGERYQKGMVLDSDGNDIDMSSSEKLWNHLTGVEND